VTAEATALTVIAVATAVMAIIQVGAIAGAVVAARRVNGRIGRLEAELRPMIDRLTAMSGEAARAAGLAAAQVERVDRVIGEIGTRADAALGSVQRTLARPAREGAALLAGVRAGVGTLRELRDQRRQGGPREDDDPLFIG
jgi:hypothetical protein